VTDAWVDRLLEADHPVVAVAPNTIKDWREAEVVSGANPIRDAAVIAGYLRLRFHLLKPLQAPPGLPQTTERRGRERVMALVGTLCVGTQSCRDGEHR
jgi:hypothetical protein